MALRHTYYLLPVVFPETHRLQTSSQMQQKKTVNDLSRRIFFEGFYYILDMKIKLKKQNSINMKEYTKNMFQFGIAFWPLHKSF